MKSSDIPKELRQVEKKFSQKNAKKSTSIVVKVIAANVVNVLLILAVFYLVGQLTSVAGRIKELRSEAIAAGETIDAGVLNADIARNQEKIDAVMRLYARDREFLDLVDAMYGLRDEGVVAEVAFPGGETTAPRELARAKAKGFPVHLTMRGSRDSVNNGLSRVLKLPFLLIPYAVELEQLTTTEQSAGDLVLKLNLYLVVNENFNAN